MVHPLPVPAGQGRGAAQRRSAHLPVSSNVFLLKRLPMQIKRQQAEEQYSERTLHRMKEATQYITKGNKEAKLHIQVRSGTPLPARAGCTAAATGALPA